MILRVNILPGFSRRSIELISLAKPYKLQIVSVKKLSRASIL